MSPGKAFKALGGPGILQPGQNMQKAALEIVEKYGGEIPGDYEKILALPGIGSYTAGAIASIAYKIPKPAVDGNVLRVIARLTEEPEDVLKQRTRKKIEDMLEKIMPADHPGEFNQSLMELGATVCVPNGPARCEACPVKDFCLAKAHEKVVEYPRESAEKSQTDRRKDRPDPSERPGICYSQTVGRRASGRAL